MDITLEKIELVKDRTGVSYKEAKDALEQTEGNVVDAIIFIEDSIDEGSKKADSKTSAIIDAIKATIKKGNASKLIIKKEGDVVINLPINIGVVGTVLFPWATVAGAIAALGTKCSIEIIKDNGEIIDISSKANEVIDVAKSKGGVVFDEVKDKGSDAFELAKEKGKDAWEFAKDKGSDAWDFAKDKGADAWDFAKDKGLDAFEAVKEKASNVIKKDKDGSIIDADEFGDLDLSDINFKELEDDDE
ncbi:MAG: DUF4342 domain-containing protein [Bacillota bacterium]|nr:DUF4342 domain-containing protein [Bacillota bacterium]